LFATSNYVSVKSKTIVKAAKYKAVVVVYRGTSKSFQVIYCRCSG